MCGGFGFDFSHASNVVLDNLFRLIGSLILILYMIQTLLSNNEFHVHADLCLCVCVCVYVDTEEVIFSKIKRFTHLEFIQKLNTCWKFSGSFENLNPLYVDKYHRWIRNISINSFLMKLALNNQYQRHLYPIIIQIHLHTYNLNQ